MSERESVSPSSGHASASGRLVARFLSRDKQNAYAKHIQHGTLRQVASVELLAQEQLQQLATRGLWLFILSAGFFVALDVFARAKYSSPPFPGGGGAGTVLLLIVVNALGYAVIIPLHEAVHALVIVALGGRPRFGLRLPLAAYCTAPGQLFTRDGYTAVAVAPLVVLTLIGIIVTWLAPNIGAAIILAMAGNISGAIGDLVAVARLRELPGTVLIADTETGFVAYAPAA